MFKNSWRIPITFRSWDKKKLKKYSLTKTNKIGFAHKKALIRFFLHIDPDELSIDKICRLECEIEWLAKSGLLSMAQVPIKFE